MFSLSGFLWIQKRKEIKADFLWLAGFLSWKVVGGVAGAASGQVGLRILSQKSGPCLENLGSNIQNMSLEVC